MNNEIKLNNVTITSMSVPNNSVSIAFPQGTKSWGTITYIPSFPPQVKKIFINNNRLVVLWSDNTRTMSTCGEIDIFDPEIGFCIALAKKIYGKKKYQRMLKKAEVQDNNGKLLKKFKKNTVDI